MAKRIKLENIISKRKDHTHLTTPLIGPIEFCPICGESILEDAIEEVYVCGNCRNLVEKDWVYCPYCREKIETSGLIEHYHKGIQLTDNDYKTKMKGLKK